MPSEIEQAIRQISEEKGLSYEAVMETIESALAAAYRKDYGDKMQNIEAQFDPETIGVRVFDVKTVVEDIPEEELEKMREKQAAQTAAKEAERAGSKIKTTPKKEEEMQGKEKSEGSKEPEDREEEKESEDKDEEKDAEGAEETRADEDQEEEVISFNPKTEIMVSDAKVLKMDAEVGDVIRTELPIPGAFGRMAAMTAKQVITQKLREAEREIIFNEFKEQEGEVLIGTVQRREGRVVLVDLGRTTGVMIPEDQVRGERYNPGDRIKVYVREVTLGSRGPQILLSRSSEELVRILFDLEIPEIAEGLVEIKGIAREAGARSKVAVASNDDSVDPIGASIGQRGIRIQTVINELGGEKIDVIEHSEEPKEYISNALAPAKVVDVDLNEEDETATVTVDDDQLSLAIGRGGQNVRLAAKLTGWKLNVREEDVEEEGEEEPEEKEEKEPEESKGSEKKEQKEPEEPEEKEPEESKKSEEKDEQEEAEAEEVPVEESDEDEE